MGEQQFQDIFARPTASAIAHDLTAGRS